jgi:alpha-tubulin suppressor-like RCC1 family protein
MLLAAGATHALATFATAATASEISDGGNHACVLASGGVRCWGNNAYGGLGDGTTTSRLAPVAVSGLTSGIAAISVGSAHTCAVTTGGGAKCWGLNGAGELGDGTRTIRLTPVNVSGLSSGVSAIAASVNDTCALTTGGGVMCWGDNSLGQLGDGTETSRLTPVSVSDLTSGVTAIVAAVDDTCALTTAGIVKCWGHGWGVDSLTPASVLGLTGGVTAISMRAGDLCALTTGGGVKCLGYNRLGQLGDGTTTSRTHPVDVVGLTSGVTAISAGGVGTCAVTTAGGMKCWGDNSRGELGDGTTRMRLTPVNVVGLASGVTAISSGGTHTCALTSAGRAMCWGRNTDGVLGDGTRSGKVIPVSVRGFTGSSPNVFRPDALISKTPAGPWIGDSVYNTDGTDQSIVARDPSGHRVVFFVRVQNDSSTSDRVALSGSGSGSNLAVRYFHGPTEITFSAVSGTLWKTIAAGGAFAMRIEITAKPHASATTTRTFRIRIESAGDSAKVDVVSAKVGV